MDHFEYNSIIDAPRAAVFAFHERPDAIEILTPKMLFPRVERVRGRGLEAGSEIIVTTLLGPWHARHTEFVRDELFVDEIVSGPMKIWRHEHRFESVGSRTRLTDSIGFEHKFAPAWSVKIGLRALFAFRHRVTRMWCEAAI